MKKRTSKSASEIPETSSQSGTSNQTDNTANNGAKKVRRTGKFAKVVDRIEAMTPEEFRQSLVAAGILNEEGGLTAKYQRKGRKGS